MFNEKFAVKKKVRGKFRIALVYPSTYKVAISNLGLRIIYHLLNLDDRVYCERFVIDSERSIESDSHLKEFNLIMFCYQYEPDLLKIVQLITKLNLFDKLKVVGGPCTCNPFPLKGIADIVYVGEAESMIMPLVENIMDGAELEELAKLNGMFVPGFSESTRKTYPKKLDTFLPSFQVSSQMGAFGDALLLDVSRGCKWGCLFCLGRNFYAPYRERGLEQLIEVLREGMMDGGYEAVALIASDLGNYSKLTELIEIMREIKKVKRFRLIVPSLRIDALDAELLEVLAEGGEKTITIAPESCEEIRCRIGKAFSDEKLLETCKLIKKAGLSKVKLYFMFGLPEESFNDLENITKLVKKIKDLGLKVKVSANPFVPKPHTPMEDEKFDDLKMLKKKLTFLRKELGGMLSTDGIRQAYLQAIIARGDERVGELLLETAKKYEEITLTALKKNAERIGIDLDAYAKSGSEERPWKKITLI